MLLGPFLTGIILSCNLTVHVRVTRSVTLSPYKQKKKQINKNLRKMKRVKKSSYKNVTYYDHTLEKTESEFEPSMTVQGEAANVRELLLRVQDGSIVHMQSSGYYDLNTDSFESDDMEEFQRLDIIDRKNITELNKQKIQQLEEDESEKETKTEQATLTKKEASEESVSETISDAENT